MNKKFLSAILFGALMVTSTGTFVSCSDDYDDDIKSLQDQINKLATKEDMTSQIATLQSALDAAKSEASAAKTSAEDALKKAQEALDNAGSDEAAKQAAQAAADAAQAKLDAANAKTEAIKAAQDEVAAIKAELEATIDSKFESAKSELAQQIAELTTKVESLTGYSIDMVTGIHLLTETDDRGKIYDDMLNLNYYRIQQVRYYDEKDNRYKTVESYIFGEGLDGAYTLKKGDVNTVTDHLLINVAPVNAAVASESLSLINGEGANLNAYVNLTANAYNRNIVKSSRSAATGLYEIGVQLKNDVDFETFDKLVLTDKDANHPSQDNAWCPNEHEYIAYALGISDGTRTVTSDFDVMMHVQKELRAHDISYVSKISTEEISNPENDGSAIVNWQWGEDNNTSYDWCYTVNLGEPFYIYVGSDLAKGGHIMSNYIVVDTENKHLTSTDKAALKLVSVTGDVNTVSNEEYHTITLSGADAAGIVVPLKLVTVDYQGNVETNVIWVKSSDAEEGAAVEFTVTPKKAVLNPTNYAAESAMQAFSIPANAEYYSIDWTIGEDNHQNATTYKWNGSLNASNIGSILELYNAAGANTNDITKVAKAKFVGNVNLQVMREDKEYVGIIKFYDKTQTTVLAYNKLSVKKVLPTVVPSEFTAKTNAIWSDNTLTVYPTTTTFGGNTIAEYKLSNSFNMKGLETDAALEFETPNFIVNKGDVNEERTLAFYDQSTHTVYINNIYDYKDVEGVDSLNIIDNGVAYPTTVTYNYGDIKYHPEGHGVNEDPELYECKIEWPTGFSIKFGCYPTACSFDWKDKPTVVYQTGITIGENVTDPTKDYDFMTAKNPYKVGFDPFRDGILAAYVGADINVGSELELWTNGDRKKKNEFFTVSVVTTAGGKYGLKLEPTPESMGTVLANDVEAELRWKITDLFGHKHYIKLLDVTILKEDKAE